MTLTNPMSKELMVQWGEPTFKVNYGTDVVPAAAAAGTWTGIEEKQRRGNSPRGGRGSLQKSREETCGQECRCGVAPTVRGAPTVAPCAGGGKTIQWEPGEIVWSVCRESRAGEPVRGPVCALRSGTRDAAFRGDGL